MEVISHNVEIFSKETKNDNEAEEAFSYFNFPEVPDAEVNVIERTSKDVLYEFVKYCESKKNETYTSHHFSFPANNKRVSLDLFLNSTKSQTKLCDFGVLEERTVRDRLVLGK